MDSLTKRTRSIDDLPMYNCEICDLAYATSKQLRNHKRSHKSNTVHVSLPENDEIEEVELPSIVVEEEELPFNAFEQRTFKTSCNFEDGDRSHVYDENIFTENTFTTSQLFSIQLYDIVTAFNVSTECHRQLVNLFNTVIRDHNKIEKEYSPKILHAGPVTTLLKQKTAIKAHEYQICENVCKLYNATQTDTRCSYCGSNRYKKVDEGSLVPAKTMKMMSLGDQLARLVGNDDSRKKLHFRANRQTVPGEMSDYFDGAEYKRLQALHFFQSPDDIAIALFLDGFVNQKKSKQEMTLVHVMILNYDPSIRYTDEYLIQLAIIPGKPKDLDSFLLPIIDEIISLGKYGLTVRKFDGRQISSKVHMVLASGDIPQVTKFIHHKGHNSTYGCRICKVKGQSNASGNGMYFQDCNAPLREKNDFVLGDPDAHIDQPSIFAKLPTFNGSFFFGLEELHLIGFGLGRLIHKLIVLANTTTTTTTYYAKDNNGHYDKARYTFAIPKKHVIEAGQCIEKSRSLIPISFQGSWDNLIAKIDGARSIDFLDFLLYVVPTLLVPLYQRNDTRKALLSLVKGCSIALQWNLNNTLINEMQNSFKAWHEFLEKEVEKKNISISVFSPVNHYLTHIAYITKKMGNIKVYSTRSMERTIGRYSKLIKSRVLCGRNAENLVERLAIRGYVNLAYHVEELLDPIKPIMTSLDDYIELPLSSPHNRSHQLWSPFEKTNFSYIQKFISKPAFIKELKTYYTRSNNTSHTQLEETLDTIEIAARALINNHVYSSQMYRIKKSETRRGNHYIKFHAVYKNQIRWFIGAVILYFSHNNTPNNEDCKQFLVLVSVMKQHSAADYDTTIPIVYNNFNAESQRFVVISLNDIQNQVGLIQCIESDIKFKVVAPYIIFNQDMKKTAGKLEYIRLP